MTAVQAAPNPTSARDPERWAWLPPLLYVAALVGIPFAVVVTTGGSSAIAFWVEAVFHLIVSFTLGAALFTLVGYLMTAPFAWLRRRLRPATNDDAASYGMVTLFVLGGTIYFLTEPSLNAFYVQLPTRSTNLGAFMVLLGSGLAGWGLIRAAGRIHRAIGTSRSAQVLTPTGAFTRGKRPWGVSPSEPGTEYWSPSVIAAWRSWAWNGRALHGYRVAWTEALLEAGCEECGSAPGWDHACGIYATKERDDVEMFGEVPVVGRVEMWGNVVEHEHGYRSSHARITDLWVGSPVHARRIGHAYPGVRVWEGLPTSVEAVGHGEHR